MTMGHREPVKTAEELDATTGWRRVLKYMRRPGVTARIKARINRRLRRGARRAIEEQAREIGEGGER